MDLTGKNNISYLDFVVDNLDVFCYISDINTCEILFMNKKLLDLLGGDYTRFKGNKVL